MSPRAHSHGAGTIFICPPDHNTVVRRMLSCDITMTTIFHQAPAQPPSHLASEHASRAILTRP